MSTAPQYTVDDYQLWEGDWELWNGAAVAMTPSPFGRHGTLLGRITTLLSNSIEAANCDANVIIEVDWIVSSDTVVRPDLSVVCGEPPEEHINTTPALVVEVLSPATRELDLTIKKQLYAQESVRWYSIIDPEAQSLQTLQLGKNGYEHTTGDTTVAIDICGERSLSVDVNR